MCRTIDCLSELMDMYVPFAVIGLEVHGDEKYRHIDNVVRGFLFILLKMSEF